MLWIALHLPELPLEALARGSPLPEACAVAERHRIIACDGKARARGVKPGISTSAASALAPQIRISERDAAAETEALLGIAAWAMQFTPNVALDFPDSVLLEISGSLKLFGGLAQILGDLREGLEAMGYTACLAVAPTARAACWLVRAGRETLITETARIDEAVSALPPSAMCSPCRAMAWRAASAKHCSTISTARGDGCRTRALSSRPRPASLPASSCSPRSRRPRHCCSPRSGCWCNWPAISPRARAECSVSP